MPPKSTDGHLRKYCSFLCGVRAFEALDKPRQDEVRSKLPGTCAYCGGKAPEGRKCCDAQCANRLRREESGARQTAENRAARETPRPCVDCGETIDRISYLGVLVSHCTRCARQRHCAKEQRRVASAKNPNLPMPRAMRELVELLRQGPQTAAALARGVGMKDHDSNRRYLRGLERRGLLVRVRLGNNHWFALAGPDGDATLAEARAVLDAERGHRAAWQVVLAARARLDARLQGQGTTPAKRRAA